MLGRRQALGLAEELLQVARGLSTSSARSASRRPRPAASKASPPAAQQVSASAATHTQPVPVGEDWTEVVHPQTGEKVAVLLKAGQCAWGVRPAPAHFKDVCTRGSCSQGKAALPLQTTV